MISFSAGERHSQICASLKREVWEKANHEIFLSLTAKCAREEAILGEGCLYIEGQGRLGRVSYQDAHSPLLLIHAPLGVPFPKNFQQVCNKILTRLFRVFVHVYIHHFDSILSMGAEAHVNTCYKHFYYFIREFSLVDQRELEPLVRPGPHCPLQPGLASEFSHPKATCFKKIQYPYR